MENFTQADAQNHALTVKVAALRATVTKLRDALDELLDVIAYDELIPESLSYMKQARTALANATDTPIKPDGE